MQIVMDVVLKHKDQEHKEQAKEYANKKRRWENAFQRWSDEHGLRGTESRGACGYSLICDYCEDNSYGRPCVRALNAMRRERQISIDYDNYDFAKMW